MSLRWRGPAAVAILVATATPVPAEQGEARAALRATTLTQSSAAADETLWAAIKDSGYRELLELFLDKYPDSPNSGHARDALAAIDGEPTTLEKAAAAASLLVKPTRSQVAAIFINSIDYGDLAKIVQLQRDLVARGCNTGSPDGVWGSRSAQAAKRFIRATGLDIDGSVPSAALGEAVAAENGDICGDFVRRAPPVATGSVQRRPVFRNSRTRYGRQDR